MTFRSDLMAFEIPSDVQLFAVSLCDALKVQRWFWLSRIPRGWVRGKERFITICVRERLIWRYGWPNEQVAQALRMHRQTINGPIAKQATALFTMYPDLQKAVCHLGGYDAGRFILEHWDVAVRASCGETELRASG